MRTEMERTGGTLILFASELAGPWLGELEDHQNSASRTEIYISMSIKKSFETKQCK